MLCVGECQVCLGDELVHLCIRACVRVSPPFEFLAKDDFNWEDPFVEGNVDYYLAIESLDATGASKDLLESG